MKTYLGLLFLFSILGQLTFTERRPYLFGLGEIWQTHGAFFALFGTYASDHKPHRKCRFKDRKKTGCGKYLFVLRGGSVTSTAVDPSYG